MSVHIIIGKNFGDEGKGLATDYFSAKSQGLGNTCLVIRHNGGAQAGHTVDLPDKRFVFHQLSSGSFRNTDTYWAQTFLPDLYKLSEEINDFEAINGKAPKIYGHKLCRCVYIDDVLVNMALETARGSNRHGSCGMGINEAVVRSSTSDNCLHLGELCNMSASDIYIKLLQLRREYLPHRLAELGLSIDDLGEYTDLLTDNNVLINATEQMQQSMRSITIAEDNIVRNYDDVIFEGAQGLLLDEDYLAFAPHLTSSKTGSDIPMRFTTKFLSDVIPEIVYVTRSYITRHGAGPLPNENKWNAEVGVIKDMTNVVNEWQGALRFAPHGTSEAFFEDACADFEKHSGDFSVSYMVTHLNESDGAILSTEGKIPVEQWFDHFSDKSYATRLYLSHTPFSRDIYCKNI